mmetsp:Transcript_71917/g.127080  ORF Transcript_71917/g.127080 Transcript_71917/m.127080 type:complete len:251 (-) Transcript_71917:78-830(-)
MGAKPDANQYKGSTRASLKTTNLIAFHLELMRKPLKSLLLFSSIRASRRAALRDRLSTQPDKTRKMPPPANGWSEVCSAKMKIAMTKRKPLSDSTRDFLEPPVEGGALLRLRKYCSTAQRQIGNHNFTETLTILRAALRSSKGLGVDVALRSSKGLGVDVDRSNSMLGECVCVCVYYTVQDCVPVHCRCLPLTIMLNFHLHTLPPCCLETERHADSAAAADESSRKTKQCATMHASHRAAMRGIAGETDA